MFLQVKTALLVGVLNIGFPIVVIAISMIALKGDLRINSIGFVCAGLNIVMCGSPLSSMVRKFFHLLVHCVCNT